jgi:Carboxylesterase family
MLSNEIFKQLECCDADSSLNLAKLKVVSAQRFAEEGKSLKEKYKLKAELVPSLDAAPNIDHPLLPSHPRMLEVADVPVMIGVTTHEGMLELNSEKFLRSHIFSWFWLWKSFAANVDIMKKHWEENYAKFVPCKELGIEENSEKCKEKWKEINSFYNKVCNGDFIEKYIFVSGNLE